MNARFPAAAADLALAAMIRALEQSRPNTNSGTSTKGGYQTAEDLLSGEHPQAQHPALLALKRHRSVTRTSSPDSR